MVNTLQFNMSVPTPYMFMKRFLKAALSDKKVNHSLTGDGFYRIRSSWGKTNSPLKLLMCNEQLELLSFFIIEVCLVEYEMLRFPPSLLAAAAIYTAQCSLYQFKQWSKTSEWHTSYTEDQLLWVFCITDYYLNFVTKLILILMNCSYMPIGNAQEWWLVSIRKLDMGNSLEFIGSTAHPSLVMQQKLNQPYFS